MLLTTPQLTQPRTHIWAMFLTARRPKQYLSNLLLYNNKINDRSRITKHKLLPKSTLPLIVKQPNLIKTLI